VHDTVLVFDEMQETLLQRRMQNTPVLFATTGRLYASPLEFGPVESVVTPLLVAHGNRLLVQAMQTHVSFDDPLKEQQLQTWHLLLSKLLSTLSARLLKNNLKRSDSNGGNAVFSRLHNQ